MDFDKGRPASDKFDQANNPNRTGDYSCYDSLCAALETITDLPSTVPHGLKQRLEDLGKHPEDLLFLVATGYALGFGFSQICRSGSPFLASIASSLPKAIYAATAVDLSMKAGLPIYRAWADPARTDFYSQQLGKNLGSLMIDYSIAGATGLAGAKAYRFLPAKTYGTSSLEGEISALSDVLKANFERPAKSPLKFDDDPLITCVKKLEHGINSYLRSVNLPDITVWDHLGNGYPGIQYHGKNIIGIDGALLTKGRFSNIANVMGHEITHTEQDTVVIRHFADKLGIGKSFSEKQVTELKTSIENRLGGDYSESLVQDVLRIRNGACLSPDQSLRADVMISHRDLQRANFRQSDILVFRRQIGREAQLTLQQCQKIPIDLVKAEFKRRLSFSELEEPLQSFYEKAANPPVKTISEWNRLLVQEMRSINRGLAECRQTYRNCPYEIEAFSVGNKIGYHNFIGTNRGQFLTMASTAVPTSLVNQVKDGIVRKQE